MSNLDITENADNNNPMDFVLDETPEVDEGITTVDAEPETEEASNEETSEGYSHSDALMESAREVGLSHAEISVLQDEAGLRTAIDALTRSNQVSEPKAETEAKEFSVELDEESMDPDVVNAIKGLVGEFNKVRSDLTNEISQLKSATNEVSQTSQAAKFDGLVSGLESDTQKLLGSPVHRNTVQKAMNRERAGYEAIGQTPPSDQELLSRALRNEFPNHNPTADSVVKKVQDRSTQLTSRGDKSDGPNISSEDKARLNFSQRYASWTGKVNADDGLTDF